MKLGFCFLIYDKINHEELWNAFFEGVDPAKYSIYIHYKTQAPLKYFEQHKLKNCIETRYENQTIPLAYNVLFREAYTDISNYKFIIVSGSCMPLKSFNYIYNQLTSNNKGYFNICPQQQRFPNCNSLLPFIDKHIISKSHNWFILNRTLVEKLCVDHDDKIDKWYKSVYAPEEYYYHTFIKLLGLEDEIITTYNMTDGATTFTNWSDMSYKYLSRNGLKNYSTISAEELDFLIKSKSIFGRKFNPECAASLEPLRNLYRQSS